MAEPSILHTQTSRQGLIGRWLRIPLYQRILIALLLGVLVGLWLGPRAVYLAIPSQIILRILGALATPLILLAVLQSLMQARLGRRDAIRVGRLLILNTIVAIAIGLAVANFVKPGRRAHLPAPTTNQSPQTKESQTPDPLIQFMDSIPSSLLKPLVDNNVIGVILVAIGIGLALRAEEGKTFSTPQEVVDLGFRVIVRMLQWVIAWVPLGVFGIVAGVVGSQGFRPFFALAAFVGAVLLALLLQTVWYLARIRITSWVRPIDVIAGMRDALLMAFSTDSSTATMPVTYACLVEKVRIRESSARLGALVGTNFNNDGTALYEAMSALFISQLIGRSLTVPQQIMVMLTSVLASVGAAGIPEAGLVTMTLVFNAVGLPTEYIPLLVTVDWFLDRSRTVINVLGDVNVSCVLDGKTPETADEANGKTKTGSPRRHEGE